jgi:hypothetical protein
MFTDAALRPPDHEFDRIFWAKTFGVREPPLRLSGADEVRGRCHQGGQQGDDPRVEAIDIDVAHAFRDATWAKGPTRGTIKRRNNTVRALRNFAKQRFQANDIRARASEADSNAILVRIELQTD